MKRKPLPLVCMVAMLLLSSAAVGAIIFLGVGVVHGFPQYKPEYILESSGCLQVSHINLCKDPKGENLYVKLRVAGLSNNGIIK